MSGAKEYLQVKFLKTLEPLGSLSVDKLEDIASKSQVEELPPGRVIFRQGEKDSRSTYLLSGQVELQVTGNPRSETLKAKTVDARYPIAQEWPRPSTCRSKTNVVLLHIDSNLLEILLSDDPSGTYEVTEIGVQEDPESDWMLRFLQSPAFLQLPTENIQSILIQLEEVPMKAGEVVINQGDSDDWYYIVKQGKCTVSRRPAPKAEEVRLAILGPGDGFGEEALITNGKRNATVTMKESGVLMRLSKSDFHRLLVDPMLRTVDHATMTDKVKAGAALIDVRTNKEFTENGLKGAQNIPVSMLRLKSKDLNTTREHIVYCNDTTQSRAAAFLLAQQSLQVYVLEGGLNGQSKPFSPAATAPVAKTTTATTTGSTAQSTVTAADLGLDAIQDTNFISKKRAAEEQEQKASAAEQARKTAAAKSSQLKERADALRAQADNLARKTASAEEEKRAAQAEIDKLKQEAIKERDQLLASVKQEKEQVRQQASQLRTEAEEARKRAEEELARIKAEAEAVAKQQNELETKFRDAETEKQKAERAAEVARLMAQQEVEKVKAEAEAIRQKALKEAERMSAELEARKAKMAEQVAHHEKTALEEARRKAALDADQIRKQALKEAEAMRIQLEQERQKAAEQVARNKAEDQLRRQELESEKQKVIEEARKQALQEAQAKAREEARRLAEAEAEEVRRQALEEAEVLRQKMVEEVSRKAMETAQLEADAIRREALEEANRLRSEMEKTRQLVESEAKRAQSRIEDDNEHTHAAKEAARLAAEEAERRRFEAEQEALAEQQRIAEEQARIAAQVEQQRIAEEQARIAAQVEQQRIAEEQALAAQVEQQRVEAERAHQAKQMAEQLRNKLDQQEAERQEEEDEYEFSMGRGPKLAKAKLHVVKGKTILEGEEDIFVFKAPSERPPSRDEAEALLKKAEHQLAEKSRNELPSFDIEYADDDEPVSEFVIDQESEFSDSILLELDNITTNSSPAPKQQQFDDDFVVSGNSSVTHRNKKRTSLIALAASVIVMVTISVVAITGPSYLDSETVASVEKEGAQPARGLASIRTRGNHKKAVEDRMKSEAESEFNKLLSDWRKRNK